MRHRHNLNRHVQLFFFVALCFSLVLTPTGLLAQDNKTPKPDQDNRVRKANYELAARWTSQKVGKLVFDTSVTPRWLETGDRFWYSYETSQGKKFYIVDPPRKTKAPLFDNAKMAAMLTNLTRIPYDAQHLPIGAIKFVKKDSAFQFDVSVPRDADIPGAKEEHFSYARRLTEEEKREIRADGKDKPPRVPAITINWSKDSGKFAVNRIDQRKVADLWVINSLAQPRPTLETYRYAMPGEVNVPQANLEVFDLASKARVIVKADRFKDQTLAISTARVSAAGDGQYGRQRASG